MKINIAQYNKEGKSILAQVTKTMKDRGVVMYTFWWNNTVTSLDAFGNYNRFRYEDTQAMREAYRRLIADGYTAVTFK